MRPMATGPHAALRAPIIATVALAAMAAAAAAGGSLFLVVGVLLGALAMIWAAGLEARREAARQERRRAEAQAASEESARAAEADRDRTLRLSSLLDALAGPVLAADAGGRLTLCNAAAAGLLGVPPDRALGRPVEELFTQEEVLKLYGEARAGKPVRSEVRVSRPGGARVWDLSMAPIPGAGQGMGGVVIGLRDITEQARAMQVRSDFAANASHELRTPIAAMRIAMDTLQSLGDNEDPAARARFLGMIARNIERLEEMVRDLLDLSRLESPEVAVRRGPVDVATLIADLEPLYAGVLRERSLTLRFDFDPALGALWSDRTLLLHILGNLIDNATKYAFEGTEVRVVGRPLGDRGVRLEVIDRGIGIPLDQQQRIFERYYQVDSARSVGRAGHGTGLGLSIVKHAARRLGGTVRVESVWQQGTRMIVDLPDSLPPANPGQKPPGTAESEAPDIAR